MVSRRRCLKKHRLLNFRFVRGAIYLSAWYARLERAVVSMSDAVLVAIIGLGGSGLGSIIGVITSSKLTRYRLEQLEKKVDKHNNLVERTYQLEKNVGLLDERLEGAERLLTEKMKVANHRIEDLEKGGADG